MADPTYSLLSLRKIGCIACTTAVAISLTPSLATRGFEEYINRYAPTVESFSRTTRGNFMAEKDTELYERTAKQKTEIKNLKEHANIIQQKLDKIIETTADIAVIKNDVSWIKETTTKIETRITQIEGKIDNRFENFSKLKITGLVAALGASISVIQFLIKFIYDFALSKLPH